MEEKNQLAVQKQQRGINVFGSIAEFEDAQRVAKVFAGSTLVPATYQNNIGNVLIAMNMANRMMSDPLMVMQNLVIVKGKPTFEAKFAIACFNATGKYSPIRYEETGKKGTDTQGMIAYAIDLNSGEVCKGPEITIGMAKSEGWYANNPKWKNIPDLMLRYRSASWFIRTTDPGVMFGFQTTDEVVDVTGSAVEVPLDTPNGIVIPQEEANKEEISMDEAPTKEEAEKPKRENKEAVAEEKTQKETVAEKPEQHKDDVQKKVAPKATEASKQQKSIFDK